MAFVVFLRGVNVGGHRRLRTTMLADRLGHLGTPDTRLGVRVTTRSWSTILRVAAALAGVPEDPQVSLQT